MQNNGFKGISNGYEETKLQFWQLNKSAKISNVKVEDSKNIIEDIKKYLCNLQTFDVRLSANSQKYDKDYIQLSRYEEVRRVK